MDQLQFSNALAEIWKFIARANKYIDETMPWALAKKQEEERLRTVMYNLLESIRIISVLLLPFMPQTPARIWRQLGMAEQPEIQTWDSILSFGHCPPTCRQYWRSFIPRLELTGEGGAPVRQATKKDKPAQGKKNPAAGEKAVTEEGLISIDEFARLDLRVAEITAAEAVSGADKLLKLQVDVGGDRRQVVAGIAKHYRPEELVGKRIVFVANLKPAKLRGVLSEGMLLAASDDEGSLVLVTPEAPIKPGSRVK